MVALPAKSYFASVPAVAQESAYSVITLLEEACNIIRLILKALVIAGPTRSKNLIANPFAVELNLVKAMAGDIRSRLFDGACDLELSPQHWHRARAVDVLLEAGLDPVGPPV